MSISERVFYWLIHLIIDTVNIIFRVTSLNMNTSSYGGNANIVNKPRKLLVLDLDNTLIISFTAPQSDTQHDFVISDGPYRSYYVIMRPYLIEFLITVSKYYDIAIWSAGTELYVKKIVDYIFNSPFIGINPVYVYSRNRCIIQNENIYKPLYKIWRRKKYTKSTTIVIDDYHTTYRKNYGNAILIKEFLGDKTDNSLSILMGVLENIDKHEDVKTGLKENNVLGEAV